MPMSLPKSNLPTTSRHVRGYGKDWEKLRKLILMRDHSLCQCNQCKGGELRLTMATEVDHIIPKAKGGTDDPSNLQAINHECHKNKTTLETGNTIKPTFGIDGYPIV